MFAPGGDDFGFGRSRRLPPLEQQLGLETRLDVASPIVRVPDRQRLAGGTEQTPVEGHPYLGVCEEAGGAGPDQAILQRRAPLAQQRLLAVQLLADPVNAHHPHKDPPADTGPTHTRTPCDLRVPRGGHAGEGSARDMGIDRGMVHQNALKRRKSGPWK